MSKITKKKSVVVTHFHKTFTPHSLTPFNVYSKFSIKSKASKSYITQVSFLKTAAVVLILETFKCCLAIILELFWVVFHEILLQMWLNLYKNFISDAMQGNI